VSDIWAAYCADLGDKPAAVTMGYTGKAILPFFGHLRPDQITRDLCRRYDKTRRSAGRAQGTVHTELGHLRSALRFALGHRAPAIWRPNKPDSAVRVLTAGEARRVIDACDAPHIRLAVVLLFGTAGRVGAILDLTWDRVDFDRGTINLRIADSATRKGRAVVPMNAMTRAALSAAEPAALSDYVVEWGGDRIGSIRKGVKSALTRAGLAHVRIHDFRHTAAVTMLGAGVPIEKVAQVLGHSNTARRTVSMPATCPITCRTR
jgi:integrase